MACRRLSSLLLGERRNRFCYERGYHATRRQEIVPFVVGGIAVLMAARYGWRALRRMDEEWDDYEWELQRYEQRKATETQDEVSPTIGIDLGTIHLKISRPNEIIINREGGRYTFAGMVQQQQQQQQNDNDSNDDVLVGQRALEKFYEVQWKSPDRVGLPFLDPSRIPLVLQEPLQDALEDNTVRTVVAAPFSQTQAFQKAMNGLSFVLVPESVAAVWGARTLLPNNNNNNDDDDAVLVMDVGGYQTSLSVVQRNVVRASCTFVFGGEDYVHALVDHVLAEHEALSQDGMAMQRLYMAAHTAVAEFNTKTAAHIHVPYIGMDLETREPHHLDTRVSRSVVEQRVTAQALEHISDDNLLSPHTPAPSDLSTLWVSIMTRILEEANTTPMELGAVLLVGGGAKQTLVETSVRDALRTLRGNADHLVAPTDGRSELVALGAASMLPNYDYDPKSGLVRRQQ